MRHINPTNSVTSRGARQRFLLELIHEQLPLPVPCYDLVLVTEFTFGRHEDGLRVLPASLT